MKDFFRKLLATSRGYREIPPSPVLGGIHCLLFNYQVLWQMPVVAIELPRRKFSTTARE